MPRKADPSSVFLPLLGVAGLAPGAACEGEGFQSIPTSLQLLHEDTQRLIDVATELLNEDLELKALLRDLGARVSD